MRNVLLFALCGTALAGCYENHTLGGTDRDAGLAASDRDTGRNSAVDTGFYDPRDAYGFLLNDGGTLPARDAGTRALPDAGQPGDLAGEQWNGYLEAFSFPSGSDHVRIVFDSWSGTGPRSGIIVLGDPTPPDPATDANVGYRPRGQSPSTLLEGFPYRFTDGVTSATRVQLSISMVQPWQPWCELQFPIEASTGVYSCLPVTMARETDHACEYQDPTLMAWVGVDCARLNDCGFSPICMCDASGCTIANTTGPSIVDFHVTGTDGVGTVLGWTAYLTRS